MAPTLPRLPGAGLAMLLGVLALYGLWSAPDLVARFGAAPAGLALLVAWLAAALLVLRSRPSRTGWAIVATLAITLRIGSAFLAAGRVSTGDSQLYLDLARNLLAGRGLVVHEPFVGLDVRGFYPPLYPLLLAGWSSIAGLSTASLTVLSTLTDAAAALLIARIGARLGMAGAGHRAAALYLIWPSVLLSAPLAQKEGLATLLVLALALAWLHAEERQWRTPIALGLAAAALALTQPGQAPLAALFGLALLPWLGWRGLLATGLPAAAVAALAMTPWWLRNALLFGRFVPLTTVSGLSLWVGSSKGATGGWMPYPRAPIGVDEVTYAEAMGRIASRWVAAHPVETIRLWAAKFVRAVGLGQGGVARLAAMHPPLVVTGLLLPLAQAAHLLLLTGASVGAALARTPGQRRLLLLTLAGVAQLLLFALPFEFAERHREFLLPFLLLLAVGVFADRRRQV